MTAETKTSPRLHAPPPAGPQRRRLSRGTAVLAVVLVVSVAAALVRATTDDGSDSEAPSPGGVPVTAPVAQPPARTDARTEAGATTAAVEFLVAYGSPAMYDPSQRRQVLAAITSPAVQAQTQAQVDEAFTLAATSLGLDAGGSSLEGELVARTIPIGTRIVDYSPDQAVISVWVTGLLGVAGLGSRYPVQESWSTATVTLDWTPQGWRWASLDHTDGPAPIGSAQVPADADAIARTARQFGAVAYAR